MSTVNGGQGNIVSSNLLVHLDAANPRSYPPPYNSITWFDISGNNNHFTLYNGVGYSSSNGGCLTFDGTNDYAASINNINLTTYNYVIIEVYVKSNNQLERMLYEHTANWNSNVGGFGLATNSNGNGSIANSHHTNHNSAAGARNYTLTGTLNWNNHVNIFSIASDSTGRLTYGNGRLLPFDSGLYSTSTSTSGGSFANAVFYIGSRGGSSIFFNGSVGSLKIYGIKLSGQQVLQNFNATRARFGI